jgi:acyl-CoA synthetase (AMP-forming)/AMP-acid ligase II
MNIRPSCTPSASQRPDHEIRLIDEDGVHFVAQGEIGEVVGHSPVIMQGYLNQPGKTAETFWHDASGNAMSAPAMSAASTRTASCS